MRIQLSDLLVAVGILAIGILVASSWRSLPAIIPIHFGARGNVNGYGSRSWILFPLILSVVICGGMLLLRRYPMLYNLPARPGTADRGRQEGLAAGMIGRLAVVLTWIFFCLALAEIHAAQGYMSSLTLWMLPLSLFATAVPIGWFLLRTHGSRT